MQGRTRRLEVRVCLFCLLNSFFSRLVSGEIATQCETFFSEELESKNLSVKSEPATNLASSSVKSSICGEGTVAQNVLVRGKPVSA